MLKTCDVERAPADKGIAVNRRSSIADSVVSNVSAISDKQSSGLFHRLWQTICYGGSRNIRKSRQRRKSMYGWRVGVLMGSITAGSVLVVNIILLSVGAATGYHSGTAELLRGNSKKISAYNTAYHTLINILSSLLLDASNYTMQVLSSPTREELDKAHKKGRWAELGLLSSRNLRIIARKRILLWWILAASSIPLHLL
jgi:hypothetical protein